MFSKTRFEKEKAPTLSDVEASSVRLGVGRCNLAALYPTFPRKATVGCGRSSLYNRGEALS